MASIILLTGGLLTGALLPGASRTSARHTNFQTTNATQSASGAPDAARREAAYRANNLGVALLEQFKYREGAEQFERALTLDSQLALAHINLAVALYNIPDPDAAAREATAALTLAPDAPQPLYLLALIARSRNQTDEAVANFRRVLALDSRDTGANVNLGQLYAQARNYPEAVRAFRTALDSEPYNLTTLYGLATVLLRSNQREEGQRLLTQFQTLRASGAGTSIGTNYLEQGRYAEALTSTGAEAGLVDRNPPAVTFSDATAGVIPATSPGQPAKHAIIKPRLRPRRAGQEQNLVNINYKINGGATLLDFDGDGDLDLFDLPSAGQKLYRNDGGKFVDVTSRSGALASQVGGLIVGAVAGDYDNDAKPDLFVFGWQRVALYHNDGAGRFSEVAAAAGIAPSPYLLVSAAFADVDHDGDLDIFIANGGDFTKASITASSKRGESELSPSPAPNRLLRNNGNGKFTDITAAAKVIGGTSNAVAVIPTDYDNRRDVDLLVVNYNGAPALYRNMRDGTFRDVAGEVGLNLKGRFLSAAAGDVNKDGYTDFFFGAANEAGTFALSDGQGRFKLLSAPAATAHASAAQLLDYDNDGLLDLFVSTPTGARLWRNVGDGWTDVSERAIAPVFRQRRVSATTDDARLWASGDVDGDGDTDLILRDATGHLRFARNDGGNRNHALRVRLAGRVSNRGGVESKVEMRAGSLWQKLEVYAASPAPAPADLLFGLGARESADAVRVEWPSGTVQSETEFAAGVVNEQGNGAGGTARVTASNASLTVTELDRKPSSCPFLYTWNGARFEFITDFMGGGEMGDWIAPGLFNTPDPDEYVRIRGDQLKARDGLYELRVTNELEEVLYVDKLQLVAVAHPQDTEVYPGEGLGSPLATEFHLFTTRDARPPFAATDDHGHDVLPQIAALDRRYPDDFALARIRGYAAEHSLTLDLKSKDEGEGTGRRDEGGGMRDEKGAKKFKGRALIAHRSSLITRQEPTLLLLTGWTNYAFSSDNVAAAHGAKSLQPPALQVKDRRGRWQTVIENIGIPVGRPQTVVVDLTGKFLSASREVRIVTNMRIYWDQILVGTSGAASPAQLTRLAPIRADLSERGFSAVESADGREPERYDYARVSMQSPWKTFTGRYTRFGDVRELLRTVDDMFVVSRPGDELSLAFDAAALAPLPPGWTRTFLLYADGFSKEMDINSASPEEVAPLPFHHMREYPYRAPETFPASQAHLDYLEHYNTRLVRAPLPRLVIGDK